MARLSKIVANEKRKKTVEKYRELRAELKKKSVDPSLSDEERFEATLKLQALPRNASPIRVRNRCELTGRSRGYISKFKLSRIAFRELSLSGMIPGVTKSSW